MPTGDDSGPTSSKDEESKQRDPENLGPIGGKQDSKPQPTSLMSKIPGMGLLGSAASKLTGKVTMTTVDEQEDNDPAKYHTLDSGHDAKV